VEEEQQAGIHARVAKPFPSSCLMKPGLAVRHFSFDRPPPVPARNARRAMQERRDPPHASPSRSSAGDLPRKDSRCERTIRVPQVP